MSTGYTIDSLTFSDGTVVPVETQGITILVGPNNAGKSLALREIQMQVEGVHPTQEIHVVKAITAAKSGDAEALRSRLSRHSVTLPDGNVQVRIPTGQIYRHDAETIWIQPGHQLAQLWTLFVYFLNAENRTNLAGSAQSYDVLNDVPQTPLQFLYSDPALEKELSKASKDAFRLPLVVNRYSGNQIHLQVGELDPPTMVPPDKDYLDKLRALPSVSAQGDGVKSFVGIMLGVSALRYPVVIIDEPEAFLHPPQARLLGRKLAELCPQGTQVFLATHSSDILQGLLETNNNATKVIRITRRENVNQAKVIDQSDIKKLWRDPLMRYSKILEGLFHRGTVICESESDVTFYSAAIDEWLEQNGHSANDYQITSCGGKHRMTVAIKALRAAGVEVRIIADFDVMREVEPLKGIVTALGGNWQDFEASRNLLNNDLSQRVLPTTAAAAKSAIDTLLDSRPGRLSKQTADQVKEIVKVENGWDQCKRSGIAGLTGATFDTALNLIDDLAELGVFVVKKGELEQFCPEVANLHGPAWAVEALKREAHKSGEPQGFVKSVIQSFPD
jgi:hypothetical protein